MYDAGKIIPGLILFLVIVTSPFLLSAGVTAPKPDPKLDTPAIKELGDQKKCVMPKEFMKAEHMVMLNQWRDEALRQDKRYFVSPDGKTYYKSLQLTCLKCHSNKKQFCDQCHNYMDVTPYCFDCHIQPEEKQGKEGQPGVGAPNAHPAAGPAAAAGAPQQGQPSPAQPSTAHESPVKENQG